MKIIQADKMRNPPAPPIEEGLREIRLYDLLRDEVIYRWDAFVNGKQVSCFYRCLSEDDVKGADELRIEAHKEIARLSGLTSQ